jgi:hypothetical protein
MKQKRKSLFDKARRENLPEASIFLWDGSIFYGRVIRQIGNQITLIGLKKKRIYIYSGEQNGQ